MECELNRKDIWFSAGKKSKQPVYGASILHQPLPWTPHISLFQRVLQRGGGGSPRGKHNYIWCDMCCNHCMCSLGKWEKRGFIFSSWGQRSLPKLVLQGERRGGAFQVTESACGRYRRSLGSGGGFGQEGLDHGWQPGSDQGSGPFFLRCQCPPAKDHHKQTCSWASWVYESLWWGRIHTILHLSKKLSETTIKLGFGFWLDGLADGPWKWGFALDWELSGSEDHSITCYINKLNQDGGDTRARKWLYLVEM